MKRIFIALLACILVFGCCDVQAQNKKSSTSKTSKSTKNKNSKTSKKGKKGDEQATINLTQLPYNSGDCIFAIPISVDQTYGPTTAPQGLYLYKVK